MDLISFKQHCERLSQESEDDQEGNAYREIVTHMETHRPDKNGLILDLAHLARDYEQRASQIRQKQPLSMLVDTLETKARIYKESILRLGGIKI